MLVDFEKNIIKKIVEFIFETVGMLLICNSMN